MQVEPIRHQPSMETSLVAYLGSFPREVVVSSSPLTQNSITQNFDGTMTIENASSGSIVGPFAIVLISLTNGATLVNSSVTLNGQQVIKVPGISALAPGQSATVDVEFTNSSSAPITFKTAVYSGTL
jgi:hypothetical protein